MGKVKFLVSKISITKLLHYIKYNPLDLLLTLSLFYFISSNNLLTSTLNNIKDFLPYGGEYRREHLLGHRFLIEPFLNGGAFTGSLGDFHPGPIPYNYPLFISWFIYDKFPNSGIYPYYILSNLLFFTMVLILVIMAFTIKKIFNMIGLYLFIFIMMLSLNYTGGRDYYLSLQSTLNPNSVQFYSILLSFLFMATVINKDKKYLFLLIFFSGILMQNHIGSFIFTFIILLYALFLSFRNKNKNFNFYFFLFISTLPWLQTLIRYATDAQSIIATKNYLIDNKRPEPWLNYTSIIEQTPFYPVIGRLNPSPYDNLASFSTVFGIFIILLPLFIYLLTKSLTSLSKSTLKIGKLLIAVFTIDIVINLLITREAQQRNHLAAYTYLFVFLFLLKIIKLFIANKFQKIFLLTIIILPILNSNIHDNNNQEVTNRVVDNKLLIKSVSNELIKTPVKLVQFDYYNSINTAYLDLIYELLINKVDLCIVKPNLKKLDEIFSYNFKKIITGNLTFIKHLYCTTSQLEQSERRSLYLVEDASSSLPNYLSQATLLTRIPNLHNRKCELEYYQVINSDKAYQSKCGYNTDLPPIVDLSLYLDKATFGNDFIKNQNEIIDSSILFGRSNFSHPNRLQLDINRQISTFVELYKYILLLDNNLLINENYDDESILKLKNNLSENAKLYNNIYSMLEFIPNIDNDTYNEGNIFLGEYRFKFNLEKVIETASYKIGNNKVSTQFYCYVKVSMINGKILYDLPICKNNKSILSDDEFNSKIKEKLLLTHINYLLYNKTNLPLSIPGKNDLLDKFKRNDDFYKLYLSIPSIALLEYSEEESERNRLIFYHKKDFRQSYDKYYDENKLNSIKLEVEVNLDHANNKSESCLLEFYQPWYYMLPNFLAGKVIDCKSIK
jgi:hypothetical protein